MCFLQREETGLEFLKPAEVNATAISFSRGQGYIAYLSRTPPAARGIWSDQRQFMFLLETSSIFSQFQLLVSANNKQLPFLALWWLVSLLKL